MQLSRDIEWSTETAEHIHSGFNVVGRDGATAGAVVLAYPKDRLTAASEVIVGEVVRAALLIWAAFSALSYLLLRLLLGKSQRRLAGLEQVARDGVEPKRRKRPAILAVRRHSGVACSVQKSAGSTPTSSRQRANIRQSFGSSRL
jgi:hypothetical protein